MGSSEVERDQTARDIGIAQSQLRDYEARLGAGFAHAGYLEEFTGLRNQLEAALARIAPQGADAPVSAVDEIVARLKTLHAAHTLDTAPERTTPHGHTRRGDHHAHSPARAGGTDAEAGDGTSSGLSHAACTVSRQCAGAFG